MNDKLSCQVQTGGDPRQFADFIALREELSKLIHPARPDVDWQRIEQLSLSLFRQNGVELQTAAWYTLARTHLTGMHGLNEGLAILDALITSQWSALWPQPVHARVEILAGLSQRLQAVLRTLSLRHSDLPQVYQAEQHLNALREVLQRLELKNACQMGELSTFMHNAAIRLENAEVNNSNVSPVVLPPSGDVLAGIAATQSPEPLVYVIREQPVIPAEITPLPEKPKSQWKGFALGVLTMLIVGGAALWGWSMLHDKPEPLLPVTADAASLSELAQQSPLWLQNYGFALAAQAKPQETETLKVQWQQHITGNAIPVDALTGWHQGMEGLQEMTRRLNELDERKGKYLTGSELKSMVFAITQNFRRAVPVEEQLYRLSQTTANTPLSPTQTSQIDMHLNQVLNRYALIKQQAETP